MASPNTNRQKLLVVDFAHKFIRARVQNFFSDWHLAGSFALCCFCFWHRGRQFADKKFFCSIPACWWVIGWRIVNSSSAAAAASFPWSHVPRKSSYEKGAKTNQKRSVLKNKTFATALFSQEMMTPTFFTYFEILLMFLLKTWKFVNTKRIKTSVLMESNWRCHLGFDLWLCPLNLLHPPIILGKRERWWWSCKQVFKNQATKSRES